MTKQEFDRIVKDAVDSGADPKEAAAYVVQGFKLPGVPGGGQKTAKPTKEKK